MPLLDPTPDLPTKAGARRRWGPLPGGARGLAIAETVTRTGKVCVAVTRDTAGAELLADEIAFFAGTDHRVVTFPDWETLVYDAFSPHHDIISARLAALNQIVAMSGPAVIVVPAHTLMHRLPPRQFALGRSLHLDVGQSLDIDVMRRTLTAAAYRAVDTVYEHGEFALRGSILDVFPMGSDTPFRIDLFDDEIETLRTFDPETQLSSDRVDRIRLLPAREFPLDAEGISTFRDRWSQQFDVDARQCPIYQDVVQGVSPAGIEYYLPLFFEETDSLFDYLPNDALLLTEPLSDVIEDFWGRVQARYENLRYDVLRPILAPSDILLPPAEMFESLGRFARVELHEEARGGMDLIEAAGLPEVVFNDRQGTPLAALNSHLEATAGRAIIMAESVGRREVIDELLRRHGMTPTGSDTWEDFVRSDVRLAIGVAPLERGFRVGALSVLTEIDLFGDHVLQKRRRAEARETSADLVVKSLSELDVGSPVVHIDHGVGRYLGLQTLSVDGAVAEFLCLGYQDDAKLYVPVASLHLISRYSGAEEGLAPLHRLGGEQWQKAKRKAAEQIRDVAAELLSIYARREAKPGFQFPEPDDAYLRFAAGFQFEETPDQQLAIEHVIADMTRPQAMDRLICGDVGFGKTEVAMRAAFIAVHSGKQVAVLVPTTLLAQQHSETFRDRFADTPVNIDVISRFRTRTEVARIGERLQAGTLDIVIGTHALIQDGLDFKDLGLLIVDEEHRFGVRQKERIKSLRSEVDILTMTATPIPRTLNLALNGMRDLTIISTPPARRLSIKTFVREHQNGLIKEAISRELMRGGQVYYLHNEVKTIERTAQKVQELAPEARIGIGHGQMRERELEQVMSAFYHKRTNVLVCTTIIETGIDIPNANTIIMDRADKFGLAQTHQLRGRVGRSHHQAYAYLLTPHPKAMTSDASKRLDAIADAQDLGAGFILATHDLEIRGAGELLGDEQSGNMQTVGFTLYMEMLTRAVNAIRDGKTPNLDRPLREGTEINLHVPALLPEAYLPDVHGRLVLYKRISNAEDETALSDLQAEMIDRFGQLPEPAKTLLRITRLKLTAESLGISRIDLGAEGGKVEFSEDTPIDPGTIVALVQSEPHRYRLRNGNLLAVSETMEKAETRFHKATALLRRIAESAPGVRATA